MSAPQDKADGCELPEELRRYYLDAMGIQLWDELYPDVAPMQAQQEVAVPAVEKTIEEIPEAVVEAEVIQTSGDVAGSNWQQLESMVQQCTQCKLHSTRRQPIFGSGYQQAKLLVIGEAPGQEEDAQGQAFVGEMGDLMTSMLKAIDLQREDIYITNIVKCYRPDKRDQLSEEIKTCHAYLRRQIALIQPKVIYAAGAMATQALLNSEDSISVLRERQHDFEGIPLIASFHPAYLLRKPSEKRKAWQDLLQVKKLLAE